MSCQRDTQQAHQTVCEFGGSGCPLIAEVGPELTQEDEELVLLIDNTDRYLYEERIGLDRLVWREMPLPAQQNVIGMYADWVKRGLRKNNLSADGLTVQRLANHYFQSAMQAVHCGEHGVETQSAYELYNALTPEQKDAVLWLDNDHAGYKNLVTIQQLMLPGPGYHDEFINSSMEIWIRSGLRSYQKTCAELDAPPTFTKADVAALTRYYLQLNREAIAWGEITRRSISDVLSPVKQQAAAAANRVQAPSPEKVKTILLEGVADGPYYRLSQQLDRATFNPIGNVIKKLGGKWDRKAQAFIFPGDAAEAIRAYVEDGHVPDLNPFDFYRTPEKVSAKAVAALGQIPDGARVLEPSAGDGALVRSILKQAPGARVDAIEIDPQRREALRGTGCRLVAEDFLKFAPNGGYDYVIMNPPFRQGIFADHILHAYAHLRPGGKLVAIAPSSVEYVANNGKIVQVREMASRIEPLPKGSFSESGTDVNTVLVVIEKPAAGG